MEIITIIAVVFAVYMMYRVSVSTRENEDLVDTLDSLSVKLSKANVKVKEAELGESMGRTIANELAHKLDTLTDTLTIKQTKDINKKLKKSYMELVRDEFDGEKYTHLVDVVEIVEDTIEA